LRFILLIYLILNLQPANAGEAMDAFSAKNYDEAYRIWARDPDKAESQYGIGRIEIEGLGSSPKNISRGIRQITKASESGYRPATQFLADWYEKEGSFLTSIKYLKKLSDGRIFEIETKIISLYIKYTKGDPSGLEEYCESASKLVNLAKQLGVSSNGFVNQRDLALCSVRGKSSIFSKDESVKFLENDALKLLEDKQYDLAYKLFKILPASDKTMYGLGRISFEGLGSNPKDENKGRDMLKLSSDMGNASAKIYLINLINGNFEAELSICKGINENDGNDLKIKCANIIASKLANGSPLIKDYCEILSKTKFSDIKFGQIYINQCSYQGFILFPLKKRAIEELKTSLSNQNIPSYLLKQIFLLISSELINEDSVYYDPLLFESTIRTLDPRLENKNLKDLVNNNVSRKKCADADHSNTNSREKRIAICSLVAYTGDNLIALELAKIFSKNTEYGSMNIAKSREMLSFIQDDSDKIKISKIEIEMLLTLSEGNHKKNLEFIESYLATGLKPNIIFLKQFFDFQNKSILEYDKSPPYTLNEAVRLSNIAIKLDELDIFKSVYSGLLKFSSRDLDGLDNLGGDDSANQKLTNNFKIIKSKIPSSDASQLSIKKDFLSEAYLEKLRSKIKSNIIFPDAQIRSIKGNPAVEVEVNCNTNGNIISRKIISSSGVPGWDQAVLNAFDKTDVLPRGDNNLIPPKLIFVFRPKD